MLFDKIELEKDEKVIKKVRKHWFIITVELLGIALVGLLPLTIWAGLIIVDTPEAVANTLDNATLAIIFGSATWLLLSVMAAAMAWTHYYLDVWIITDRRIIVIDQIHFFNRKVSSFRLERLQDIKVSIRGIIATLLNFGTIRAQTASAAESNFTSYGLPAPRELQSLIQTAMDARLAALNTTAASISLSE